MSKTKDDSFYELFDKAVGAAQEGNSKDKANDNLMVKQAKVIGYDGDTYKTFVYFIDDLNQTSYTFYNKTGEALSEGDTVKVYYTSNPAKGWIGMRCGEPDISAGEPLYISAKATNTLPISYDAIERGILSVDFTVEGTDSDVVFTGNQLCDTTTEGTLKCIYKVDGATQDFKPSHFLATGKHVISHIYPMPLNTGKHNFAVYVLSPDGGKGKTEIDEFVSALSGQISGLKKNDLLNENLVLYFADVPAGAEIELPKNMYHGTTTKDIDWGDGSITKESPVNDAVVHTYEKGGDYTVTVKSDCVNFGADGYYPTFSENFNTYIKRIYFPDGAKAIWWSASTKNLPNLETLVFGKSATSIRWSFEKSPKITTLFIPETTKTLMLFSFDETAITSFIVPKNVNYTDGNLSPKSASLTSLEIYSYVTPSSSGGDSLNKVIVSGNAKTARGFSDCTSLYDVTLGEKITLIDAYAFRRCSSLSELVLPQKLTGIGESSFEDCDKLSELILPPNLITIYNSAFKGSGLTSIDIPNKVTSIGSYAFSGCESLTSVRIGSSVSNIGKYAFNGCSSLVSVNIPEKVAQIKDATFQGCTSLPSIVIPDNVISIGRIAFNGCIALTSVKLGTGIDKIDTQAFQGCTALSDINFPDGLNTIGSSAFENTGAISPEFPASLASIGSKAFLNSGITSAVLRKGMTCGGSAFKDSNLNNLTIEDGFGVIPYSCFSGTSSLGFVHIPGSVTDIDDYAFSGSGVNVRFSEGLSTIGEYAFSSSGVVGVNIPSTVVRIKQRAFSYCLNLQTVSLKSRITLGNSIFYGCKSLMRVDMGGTNVISAHCFSGCENLRNVKFATDTAIYGYAFQGCGFTSLNILNYVEMKSSKYGGDYNIGAEAFADCTNLASVDGYEYEWDVVKQCDYYSTYKDANGKEHRDKYQYTDYNTVVKGICNRMKAYVTTSSRIFRNTALKHADDYPNKDKSDLGHEYTYFDQKSENPYS